MGNDGAKRIEPIQGSAAEIADQLRRFAEAGASHIQLVVDPITRASIESLAEVLARIGEIRRDTP
jgi:alkanesulfonate monooxygenase SsuD/methylene tetrahydromethanopterin reductase-like flavin-dependent oxidoreductase (luciferase family)